MMAFSAGVGLVLGLILRRDLGPALRLAGAIAASMCFGAVLVAWVLYLLPI
jgi:hypothetical protein